MRIFDSGYIGDSVRYEMQDEEGFTRLMFWVNDGTVNVYYNDYKGGEEYVTQLECLLYCLEGINPVMEG